VQEIERLVNRKTMALIVMHYSGYPCQVEEILTIAEKHGLWLFEDAANAPGASLAGRALGT
jgi:dTDP-4-amino-4,6-dideoxygalactose transaminase